MRRVPAGVGWWGQGISSTSSSEPFRKKIRLMSSINGKSPTGRSQRITSPSNPSRKHAPRAATCQLTRLESSRNSSTYLSNLRPPCRNPHSASSAEVILAGGLFCHESVVRWGCTEEPGTRNAETRNFFWIHLINRTRRWRTQVHTLTDDLTLTYNNPRQTWGRTDYLKGNMTGNTWDEIKTQMGTN